MIISSYIHRLLHAVRLPESQAAVEKGRSRPTSAPVRPSKLSPNQQAMLQERLESEAMVLDGATPMVQRHTLDAVRRE